jgi:hypothetical protein
MPTAPLPHFLSEIIEQAMMIGLITKTDNGYNVTPRGMEYQEILIHLFV